MKSPFFEELNLHILMASNILRFINNITDFKLNHRINECFLTIFFWQIIDIELFRKTNIYLMIFINNLIIHKILIVI